MTRNGTTIALVATACMAWPLAATAAAAARSTCSPSAATAALPRAALADLGSAARDLAKRYPHGTAVDLRAAAVDLERFRNGMPAPEVGQLRDDIVALQGAAVEADGGTLRSQWRLEKRIAPVAAHLVGYEVRLAARRWTHRDCVPDA